MLVDSVDVTLRAGKGGDGVVSWRREKYVPKGGPDGGDGGDGGSIYLRASHNQDTLSSFRFRKEFKAHDGENGRSKKMAGKGGEDLELLVPVGTIVLSNQDHQVLADLDTDGRKILIVRGGKGGLGNVHFATATHQQPTESTKGTHGETREVTLQLEMIADVALVGLPNAGKSSIINALTGVEARIGAFAFSTTSPVLGVLRHEDLTITLIDLPGLIEGAHKGRGLGDSFLKHTKRVKALAHVVDATNDIQQSLDTVNDELQKFDSVLLEKPKILIINKIDLLKDSELKALKKSFPDAIFISAEKKTNINTLRNEFIKLFE
ncbi:GTPase ObgE [Candidatus Berkelbacteria bacterium]|nr:GTPase ObgE [Candidatus Berkelbacteria bacterium]